MMSNDNKVGVVPYIKESDSIQYLLHKKTDVGLDESKKFQIAIGEITDGISPEQAAWQLAKSAFGLFEGNARNMTLFRKGFDNTTIFAVEVDDPNLFGDADSSVSESTIWMSEDNFIEMGRQAHIPVIKSTTRRIINGA